MQAEPLGPTHKSLGSRSHGWLKKGRTVCNHSCHHPSAPSTRRVVLFHRIPCHHMPLLTAKTEGVTQSHGLEDLDDRTFKMRLQAGLAVSPACERRQPLAPRVTGGPSDCHGSWTLSRDHEHYSGWAWVLGFDWFRSSKKGYTVRPRQRLEWIPTLEARSLRSQRTLV